MDSSSRGLDLPVRGQGLALDLVSTEYVRGGLRGRRLDALTLPEHLTAWTAMQRWHLAPPPLDATPLDLLRARELRGAIRSVLEQRFSEGNAARTRDTSARGLINSTANMARLTRWLESDNRSISTAWIPAEPWTVALSQIANDALRILSDTQDRLHRCSAPGCILFFWDETGRRRWCSQTCGTRVRVARHATSR